VVLLDVDVHVDGEDGGSKQEYLARVSMVGHWKKHDRVVVPADRVSSMRRLVDI
jgi:hypothetical protein